MNKPTCGRHRLNKARTACEECGARFVDDVDTEQKQPNGLTLAQQELFIKLQEEHLEVAHVCSKILLYGLDDVNPVEPSKGTNRDRLHTELGDTKMFEWLLTQEKLINFHAIEASMWAKLEVLPKWLKHYVITPELQKLAKYIQDGAKKMREASDRLSQLSKRVQDNLTPREREVLKERFGVGSEEGGDSDE